MIYQHRRLIARGGRLQKRHEAFQESALAALDDHGSVLIGAWEILIGPEASCSMYQMRQFDGLAEWEQHQERVRQDRQLAGSLQSNVFPYNDFVETAILRVAEGFESLAATWPPIAEVRGQPRGYLEQRIITFRPGRAGEHHEFYLSEVAPALEGRGGELIGLFDTVIGPGTNNASSHRSVELRRFADMAAWQNWRDTLENDRELAQLINIDWLAKLEQVDSILMRPLDYSRIR